MSRWQQETKWRTVFHESDPQRLSQIRYTLSFLQDFAESRNKMYVNIKRESGNVLWATDFPFPPGRNEPLLSLGSMAHCLFVSLLTALPTVCQGSSYLCPWWSPSIAYEPQEGRTLPSSPWQLPQAFPSHSITISHSHCLLTCLSIL